MSTLITHIFNEEFLLPYFINHHREMFDQVFVIDYNSTDKSKELVGDLAPHWKLLDPPTPSFDPVKLDKYIMFLEKELTGPRIALTVTEFLLGDPNLANGQIIIPSVSAVNMPEDAPFIFGKPFHEQRKFGIYSGASLVTTEISDLNLNVSEVLNNSFLNREKTGRSIHSSPVTYEIGRHFHAGLESAFLIYRVSNCFVSEQMYRRRLQIQDKLDKNNNLEYQVHHSNFGKGLTRENLIEMEKFERTFAKNLGQLIDARVLVQGFSNRIKSGEAPTREQSVSTLNLVASLQSRCAENDLAMKRLSFQLGDQGLSLLDTLSKLSFRGKRVLLFQFKVLERITRLVRRIKNT